MGGKSPWGSTRGAAGRFPLSPLKGQWAALWRERRDSGLCSQHSGSRYCAPELGNSTLSPLSLRLYRLLWVMLVLLCLRVMVKSVRFPESEASLAYKSPTLLPCPDFPKQGNSAGMNAVPAWYGKGQAGAVAGVLAALQHKT